MTDVVQSPSTGNGSGPHSASSRRGPPLPEPVIIAESPSMRRAVELARRFAPLSLPVVLIGETGTGKEVLAQAIHRWSGRRGELVDVDCGALSPGMVVAELFGHRKGAYTTAVDSMPGLVERANRGTLFLDELLSLSVEGQSALLRVLETGEVRRVGDLTKTQVSIRLIAALQEGQGGFPEDRHLRPDLYQRLAGGIIQLLPIRERREDLWPLAQRFAEQAGRGLSSGVRQVLERYEWPGNVRELRHVISRAACLQESGEVDPIAIAEAIDVGCGRPWIRMDVSRERRTELESLRQAHGGDPAAMAAALGVSRSTLYRRLQEVGLRLR